MSTIDLTNRVRVADVLRTDPEHQTITVAGWVRTKRAAKNVAFIDLNDGSSLSGLQIVCDTANQTMARIMDAVTTGASMVASGQLVPSEGKNQRVELAASQVEVAGTCPAEEYPLQKKRHSFEFLREIAHLRARTNTFGAVARVRNYLSYAIHRFFQERGFLYINTPIITASDAEGAGELFQVTTLDLEAVAAGSGPIDYGKDYFERPAFLTVSGQLGAETYSCALDRVYTFGPTFRAENSNTTRHLAEFWMIEPEVSFCDIHCNMDLAEEFLKTLIRGLLTECEEDMAFFDLRIEPGLIKSLEHVASAQFDRIPYSQAIEELSSAPVTFEFPVSWGADLQSEHEKYLTEQIHKAPVIVTDYPKDIKAFYMRNNDDGKTVRGMDVLVPRLGEIIGGSQREERTDTLMARIDELGLKQEDYWWYLELRTYGTVPHSGFGLGFERFIQYCTGMQNIRDVIPYPRTPGNARF